MGEEKKSMQNVLGHSSTSLKLDAINDGHGEENSESTSNDNVETFEPLPVPKKLVMSGENEPNMPLQSTNHNLPKAEWSEFQNSSKDGIPSNQENVFSSKQSVSSSHLSVQERIENLLSKNVLATKN